MADKRGAGREKTPEEIVARGERIAKGEGEALEAAVGAVAGAAAGLVAGPIGVAAGAALGAAAGVALAHQIRRQTHEEADHDRDLEEGILEALPPESIPDRPSLEDVKEEMERASPR